MNKKYRLRFDNQISINVYSKEQAVSFKKYLDKLMPGKVRVIEATNNRGCSIDIF